MTNTFISIRSSFGSTVQYVDALKVADALAKAWGAERGECEPGPYGIGRVIVDGRLTITIRPDSRKLGKIEVFASCPYLERKLDAYSRPKFPKASADTGKGIDRLAADLKRRVIDEAKLPLAQLEARFNAQAEQREQLQALADALAFQVPGLRVDVPQDETRLDASFSASAHGVHVSGRLSSSGSVSLDRVTGLEGERGLAVLQALLGASA